jgi:hypothetical protein
MFAEPLANGVNAMRQGSGSFRSFDLLWFQGKNVNCAGQLIHRSGLFEH